MKEVVLKPEEWQHLLQEEDNETLLLKHIPATSGKPARWFIRSGNYITLGELFVFGFHKCSCWDLYRTYTSLEVFIDRKKPFRLEHGERHPRTDRQEGTPRLVRQVGSAAVIV